MLEFLKKFLTDKKMVKKAEITLLCILLPILLVVVYFKLFGNGDAPYEGTPLLLMCKECKELAKTMVKADLTECVCSKCGGKMGYAKKCTACHFEFPYFPIEIDKSTTLDKQSLQNMLDRNMKCPHCGETNNVFPMQPN